MRQERAEDAGQSRFLPLRGLRGWPARLLFWQKGPWELGGGGERIETPRTAPQGRGRSLLVRRAHVCSLGFACV